MSKTGESINIQDVFLNRARKLQMPVTIHVLNGYQIKDALIKGYDNFVVLIEAGAQQMLLYKHAISSITPAKPIEIFKEDAKDAAKNGVDKPTSEGEK